jgi:predicted DNA-binding transcriptional regulator AlpA
LEEKQNSADEKDDRNEVDSKVEELIQSEEELVNKFGELITPEEAGDFLNISESTLANWRSSGGGPKFVKLGRVVRYPISFIDEYLETYRSTTEYDVEST